MSPPIELAIGDRGPRWFLIAFLVTQLVEVPIYERALRERHSAPATRGAPPDGPPTADKAHPRARAARIWIAFGASTITHPIVWFAMPALTVALLEAAARRGILLPHPGWNTIVYGLLAEGFAVGVEALYLRAFRVRRALLWSVAANACSVVLGTALVRVLG
ncbi:MAG: hypothetical protein R3B70_24720 [Polyangiaceae bacterium]